MVLLTALYEANKEYIQHIQPFVYWLWFVVNKKSQSHAIKVYILRFYLRILWFHAVQITAMFYLVPTFHWTIMSSTQCYVNEMPNSTLNLKQSTSAWERHRSYKPVKNLTRSCPLWDSQVTILSFKHDTTYFIIGILRRTITGTSGR